MISPYRIIHPEKKQIKKLSFWEKFIHSGGGLVLFFGGLFCLAYFSTKWISKIRSGKCFVEDIGTRFKTTKYNLAGDQVIVSKYFDQNTDAENFAKEMCSK